MIYVQTFCIIHGNISIFLVLRAVKMFSAFPLLATSVWFVKKYINVNIRGSQKIIIYV